MSSERTLAVFNQVSAVSLKALVERGLAEPGGDAFLQLSNLVLEADLTQQAQVLAEDGTVATAGARVRRLATLGGVVLVEDGAILTSAPALNVAVTNALFEGRAMACGFRSLAALSWASICGRRSTASC